MNTLFKIIVSICRVFVGVLFIISGLIKANDTIGFGYKLEEYFQVFGTDFTSGPDSVLGKFFHFLESMAVEQAILICIVEILLGVLLLLGKWKKFTLWMLALMIVFFTFLTYYSAHYNKVTDCGCFGDALKLTPWQSFTKDVVLLVLIAILIAGYKWIQPIFSKKATNIVLAVSTVLTIIFPLYTFAYMPVKDFRPYAIGNDIKEGMKGGTDGKYETVLVYKNLKTGQLKEFTNDAPWADTLNWAWDSTITKEMVAPILAPIHDFLITDVEGSDYTEDILNYKGYQFFLVSRDLAKADRDIQPAINTFAQKAEKAGIPFYGLTSETPSAIDQYRHEVQAMYAYYIVDATQLKTMIRANPGLILLKGSVVKGMWGHNSFPEFKEVQKMMQ